MVDDEEMVGQEVRKAGVVRAYNALYSRVKLCIPDLILRMLKSPWEVFNKRSIMVRYMFYQNQPGISMENGF